MITRKLFDVFCIAILGCTPFFFIQCSNDSSNPLTSEQSNVEMLQITSKAALQSSGYEPNVLNSSQIPDHLFFYIVGNHHIDYNDNVTWCINAGGNAYDPNDDVIDGTITGLWEGGNFIGTVDIFIPNDPNVYHHHYAQQTTGDLGSGEIEYVSWGQNNPASPSTLPSAGEYTCILYNGAGTELQSNTINLGQEDIDPHNQPPVIVYPDNGSIITDRTPTFHWLKFPGEPESWGTMENDISLWGPVNSPDPISFNYVFPEGSMDQEFFATYNGPALIPGVYELNLHQNVLILDIPNLYSHGSSYVGHNRKIRFTIASAIVASIDIDPNTLNLSSQGKWITAYIMLPGYNVEDINISTIKLWYQESNVSTDWGEVQNDVLMVKFYLSDAAYILEIGEAVELTVKGELFNETAFEGSDTIKVIGN